MRLSTHLTRSLTDEQIKLLSSEIKSSLLAKCLREFLKAEIERSYRAEEVASSSLNAEQLPLYLKEVGERRGYRQVLNLILEE